MNRTQAQEQLVKLEAEVAAIRKIIQTVGAERILRMFKTLHHVG